MECRIKYFHPLQDTALFNYQLCLPAKVEKTNVYTVRGTSGAAWITIDFSRDMPLPHPENLISFAGKNMIFHGLSGVKYNWVSARKRLILVFDYEWVEDFSR